MEALAAGARVFDTRTSVMMAREPVAGATQLLWEDVQEGKLPDVAKHEPVYVICERGQVSELVGLYLEAAGFEQVFNVAGGMKALRQVLQ